MLKTKTPPNRSVETEPGTDWTRVEAMTDEEIHRAIEEDPDASPIWTEEDFRTAELVLPRDRPTASRKR